MHEDCPEISHKVFIAETSFWAAIALARLSAPPRALLRHTRVLCKLSEESRADYPTLLAHLLIGDGDALLATSAPLPGPFSSVFSALPICYVCRQTCLA